MRGLSVPASPGQRQWHMPPSLAIVHGFWGPNSGPCTYKPGTLLTELFPQPSCHQPIHVSSLTSPATIGIPAGNTSYPLGECDTEHFLFTSFSYKLGTETDQPECTHLSPEMREIDISRQQTGSLIFLGVQRLNSLNSKSVLLIKETWKDSSVQRAVSLIGLCLRGKMFYVRCF